MSTEKNNKVLLQTQVIAQWITSLAISVVCCAILFIVFAGYIVKVQEANNLLTVKIEYLEERYRMLSDEVTRVHRAPQIVQIMSRPSVAAPAAGAIGSEAVPLMSVPAPIVPEGGVVGEVVPAARGPAPVAPTPTPTPTPKSEAVPQGKTMAPPLSALPPDTATGKGAPSAGIEEGIVVPDESVQPDTVLDPEVPPAKVSNVKTKPPTP